MPQGAIGNDGKHFGNLEPVRQCLGGREQAQGAGETFTFLTQPVGQLQIADQGRPQTGDAGLIRGGAKPKQGRTKRPVQIRDKPCLSVRLLCAGPQQGCDSDVWRKVLGNGLWLVRFDDDHSGPTTFSMQTFSPTVEKGFVMKLFMASA